MRYVVQTGDTLCLIADKFGVDVNDLYEANPEIRNPNILIAGQIIIIPTIGSRPPRPPEHPHRPPGHHEHGPRPPSHHGPRPPGHHLPPRPPRPPVPQRQRYVVQAGDTLFFIARRFGINLSTLIALNPQIADPNVIYPGQVIFIP